MAGNDGMPPLELFSPDPWHTVSTRWDRWLKRFENYVLARGIKEDIRKRAMLLHCVGEDVLTRFETLGPEEELKTYDLAVKALNNLFNPQNTAHFGPSPFQTQDRNGNANYRFGTTSIPYRTQRDKFCLIRTHKRDNNDRECRS